MHEFALSPDPIERARRCRGVVHPFADVPTTDAIVARLDGTAGEPLRRPA